MGFSVNIYEAYCRGWSFGRSQTTEVPKHKDMVVSAGASDDARKQEILAFTIGVKHALAGEEEPRSEIKVLEEVSSKLRRS